MIHAGLYYGASSLKSTLCVKGKHMLYELCDAQRIPYRKTGKWIVAQSSAQHDQLRKIHDVAQAIGIPLHFISLAEARRREPDVRIDEAVLESPTTGIVDSHALMAYLEADFLDRGGDVAYCTIASSIEPLASGSQGYRVTTQSSAGSQSSTSITTSTLVNSAGLAAVDLSNHILPPSRRITPFFAKGSYYSYAAPSPRPKTLIYPAPVPGAAGLGTHLTMDLTGAIRFGPDVEWVDDPADLSVSEARLPAALAEIQTYLPGIQRDKLAVDYCGIRPKLAKGGGFQDFIVRKEDGFTGLVNLLGIESPGLTSSLAIAELVHDLLYN